MNTLSLELDRTSSTPIYRQLAGRFESAIHSGQWGPGSKLPDEVGLAVDLQLSRPTVRRAIQELVDKGLVVRRRGVGTRVLPTQVTNTLAMTSLYEDLARNRQSPRTTVISCGLIPATDDVAAKLEVPVGSPIMHLRRLRWANGIPLAILVNHLAPTMAFLRTADLERGGLYPLLRAAGIRLRVATQHIGARAGTDEECLLLDDPPSSPLLTIDRRSFDDTGECVEWAHHAYRSAHYSFESNLFDR